MNGFRIRKRLKYSSTQFADFAMQVVTAQWEALCVLGSLPLRGVAVGCGAVTKIGDNFSEKIIPRKNRNPPLPPLLLVAKQSLRMETTFSACVREAAFRMADHYFR